MPLWPEIRHAKSAGQKNRHEAKGCVVLKKIWNKLFYNPYQFARINADKISMGNTVLDKSFRVAFNAPRTGLAVQIGNESMLRNNIIFESDEGMVSIGDRTFINGGTSIICRSKVHIGNDVTIAWGCMIYDHDSHSLSYADRLDDHRQQMLDWQHGNMISNKDWSTVRSAPIHIGDHAWLGFDVTVLKGVTIGEGAVIGAKSVVTRDIPAWCVAAGNPARVVKEIPPELRKYVPHEI